MMVLAALLLAASFATQVNANENITYFESPTISEYAHFLFGSVGQRGFMRLSNPVLDENNSNQWGSDMEESPNSLTRLVSPSVFKQVGNNQFYSFHAHYEMPKNNHLSYQYLYFDFLPLGSTFDQTQPSVLSRDYFSVWTKSSAPQRFRLQLHFENDDPEKSDVIEIPRSSDFINWKVPVNNIGSMVSKVSLMVIDPVSGEQTVDFALLAFTESKDRITTMPSIRSQDNPFEKVPAPLDCLNHYPDFLNEITPYALYRVTDQVPNESRHNLAVLEAGGTIESETLNWLTTGQHLSGAFSVKTEFTLPSSSYIYFRNFYGSQKVSDKVPTPVDVSDFGTHICLWIRFPEKYSIDLTFVSNSTHQSHQQIYIDKSDWTNTCVELSSMLLRREYPADLADLSEILISFTNPESAAASFVLEYTMIYFTNQPKIYTVIPAVQNPALVLRNNGEGGCEYVSGPDQDTIPPNGVPPKTPLSEYERSYSGNFPAENRLAVLVIDENSKWLALVHALKIMGIPLVVTNRWQDAIRHKTVIVYPEANDDSLSQLGARRLARHSLENKVIFIRMNTERLHGACGVTTTVESKREYSHIKFEADVKDSPAALFGCDKGPKLASYNCPSGSDDSERYVKIWEDWAGPYNYGRGRPAQSIVVDVDAEAVATYTRRTPVLTADGQYEYDENQFVRYTEEDTAEISVSRNGRRDGGFCYVVGVDLGELCSDSRNYDFGAISRTYSSSYEPGLDMLLRMIKNIYTLGQQFVTLHPIPHGKRLAVMYTHDVDANAPEIWKDFAVEERNAGISSTFLLYTKVTRDDYDVPFFLNNEEALVEIVKLGHELGSHSVSHSPNFFAWNPEYNDFPMGNGKEQYSYGSGYAPKITCTNASHLLITHPLSGETVSLCDHPAYRNSDLVCNYWRRMNGSDDEFSCGLYESTGGTVLGDLRVSKFLIESVYKKAGMAGKRVNSFRPGHLKYPSILNEALEASGFTVSSINQANELATHLYFRMLFGHDDAARVPDTVSGVNVFEMPIQFEDTVSWPLRASHSEGYNMAKYTHDTAARIAKYGGIVVVLTHPTDEAVGKDGLPYTGRNKMEWEIEFTDNIRDYASFLTLTEMGDFAAARDVVEVDFKEAEVGGYIIQIQLSKKTNGLTLEVPSAWTCSFNDLTLTQMVDHLDTAIRLIVMGGLEAGTHIVECE